MSQSKAFDRFTLTQTLISIGFNTVLGMGISGLININKPLIPFWGAGGVAFDFIPQIFMSSLATVIALSLVTRQALKSGGLPLEAGFGRSFLRGPKSIPLRVAFFALLFTLVLTPVAAGGMAVAYPHDLTFPVFLGVKFVTAVCLSLIISPVIVKAAAFHFSPKP
jgi:hypothetical protein